MEKFPKNFMVNMTVRDVDEALKTVKTVVIPVGVLEQHGFHLPLSTDIYNCEMPLKLAGDRLHALVAPTINYCFSGGELTGTVNVSPQVFGLYVMDICSEFIRMGFKNVVLFLGHGGTDNLKALKDSLQMLHRRNPQFDDVTLSLVEVFNLSKTWNEGFNMTPQHDYHAGLDETSLMKYWAPELVGKEYFYDEKELLEGMRTDPDWYASTTKKIDSEFVVPIVHQKKEVKVGVMGFPELSTKELGEKIANELVEGIIEYVDMLNENTK